MQRQEQSQYKKAVQKRQRNFLPWLIVAIVIVTTVGLRLRLLDVPLERDEGEYAYAGQLILQGVSPYSLIYNMKFPGIYAAYALILAVFGQTHSAIHFGVLIINAVTILLIFLLTKYLIDSFAAVFAAAAFAIMSLAKSVQGISANAEHFVILFAIAGILLLVLAIDRNSLLILLAASILLGIGFLMKQHGAAFIALAGLYLFWTQFRQKPFKLKPFLLRATLFVVGVLLPFGVTCLTLWHLGVFKKFWFWTFVYAREYVSITSIADGLRNLKSAIIPIVGSAVLIWIVAGIGLLTLFIEKKSRDRRQFITGFLLFSFLATCPGLYFRPHYFVLLLPAVALLLGVGLFGIRQILKLQKATIGKDLIAVFLGLAVLSHALLQQKNILLAKDPVVVSRIIYDITPFPESLKIAEFIKANSSSNDTIAILGSEPQIFFYANRRSAASYVYAYPLTEPHPYALQMQEEMIRQIETAKPKFMVLAKGLSWAMQPTSEKMILNWGEKYQEKYYNLVGFIDILSKSKTIYRWNEDAVRYTPLSEYWLAVFERKSGI